MPPATVTVLVVDDEPPIRRFLRTTLTAAGYRVVETEDAAGTLRLLAAERPDMIFLDLGLPDRSGLELIGDVRKASTTSRRVRLARPALVTRQRRHQTLDRRQTLLQPR